MTTVDALTRSATRVADDGCDRSESTLLALLSVIVKTYPSENTHNVHYRNRHNKPRCAFSSNRRVYKKTSHNHTVTMHKQSKTKHTSTHQTPDTNHVSERNAFSATILQQRMRHIRFALSRSSSHPGNKHSRHTNKSYKQQHPPTPQNDDQKGYTTPADRATVRPASHQCDRIHEFPGSFHATGNPIAGRRNRMTPDEPLTNTPLASGYIKCTSKQTRIDSPSVMHGCNGRKAHNHQQSQH